MPFFKTLLTTISLFLSICVRSQVVNVDPVTSAVGVGALLTATAVGDVVHKIKENKKKKHIAAAIVYTKINGVDIPILRINEEEIWSKAKASVVRIQKYLDECNRLYNTGQHINIWYSNDFYILKNVDKKWPVALYETELEQYKIFENKLLYKEKLQRDSLLQASGDSSLNVAKLN